MVGISKCVVILGLAVVGVLCAGSVVASAQDEFELFEIAGDPALGTDSTLVNLHSHYTGASLTASDSSFSGRLRIEDGRGGVGVTFMSGYPDSAGYYRLRRYQFFPELHLSQHGSQALVCAGS